MGGPGSAPGGEGRGVAANSAQVVYLMSLAVRVNAAEMMNFTLRF